MLDRRRREDHHAAVEPPVEDTQYVPDAEASGIRVTTSAQHFGRFRVCELLGVGATGSVYRAHDDVLHRDVAIKALHQNCDPTVRARFLNEARAIGSVLHPHILAVFDAGTEPKGPAGEPSPAGEPINTPYIVIELAHGSLRDAMRRTRLDVDEVRRVGIQIARALGAAHAAKILHRDVKPANILSTEAGVWKLADFGIARLPDSTLTDTGQFLGSPSYAAPESLRAAQFTPASDIYALAATLYEALAGAPPHGDHDMTSVVRKLDHDATPLHLRCPVPRAMADVIMDALARDPAKRPAAEDFARRLAGDDVVEIVPVPQRPESRSITGIAIGVAIIAACLLALAIVVRVRDTKPAPSTFASPRVHKPDVTQKPPQVAAPEPPPAPGPPASIDTEPPAIDDAPLVEVPAEPAEPAAPIDPYAEASPDPWSASPRARAETIDPFASEPQPHAGPDDEGANRLLEQMHREAQREWRGLRGKDRPRRGRRHRDDQY
jgi:serine/threonine-protein kinase